MKRVKILLSAVLVVVALQSCNDKNNLEEVVEVPEPQKEEDKVQMGNPDDVKADAGSFQVAKLPYAYDALEPHVDAKTMETHYSKHYLG